MVLSWSAFFASFLVSTAVTCDSTGATVLATYFFVAHPAVPSKLRARAPAIIVSLMAHPFIFPTNLEALIQTLNRRFSSAGRETSPILFTAPTLKRHSGLPSDRLESEVSDKAARSLGLPEGCAIESFSTIEYHNSLDFEVQNRSPDPLCASLARRSEPAGATTGTL